MRAIAALLTALALAACAAGPPPDRPDCAQPTDKPLKDGGIGGTGNTEECPE